MYPWRQPQQPLGDNSCLWGVNRTYLATEQFQQIWMFKFKSFVSCLFNQPTSSSTTQETWPRPLHFSNSIFLPVSPGPICHSRRVVTNINRCDPELKSFQALFITTTDHFSFPESDWEFYFNPSLFKPPNSFLQNRFSLVTVNLFQAPFHEMSGCPWLWGLSYFKPCISQPMSDHFQAWLQNHSNPIKNQHSQCTIIQAVVLKLFQSWFKQHWVFPTHFLLIPLCKSCFYTSCRSVSRFWVISSPVSLFTIGGEFPYPCVISTPVY